MIEALIALSILLLIVGCFVWVVTSELKKAEIMSKKNTGMTWFWRYMNYLATWRTHRIAIKQLNALTDKELADIGIARADIDRLVWLEEDKTMRGRGKPDE